ncbi:hypothetical protein BVX93_01230 [bacterium B13(2017)]|nr:hypothetical protein BVX93_01230 [bacterium B13(2017)]
MKKSSLVFIIVLLSLGIYFLLDSQYGNSLVIRFFSKDLHKVREFALSFMEDIRFKDFEEAAAYHSPEDRKHVDIPYLIERLFKIKPEFLDILEYKIAHASLDSSGKRGRVKIRSKVHLLNTDKIEFKEIILYFHNKTGKWYMELESSLRQIKSRKKK